MEISPGNVSDRKRPLPKILKIKKFPRHKTGVGSSSLEILHNLSNLSVKNRRECARIANRGRRFLTYRIFTLDDPEKSLVGECFDRPVLSPELEDSPGSISTGESPLEKGGQQYDPRDARAAFVPELLCCLVDFLDRTL